MSETDVVAAPRSSARKLCGSELTMAMLNRHPQRCTATRSPTPTGELRRPHWAEDFLGVPGGLFVCLFEPRNQQLDAGVVREDGARASQLAAEQPRRTGSKNSIAFAPSGR